MLLFPLLLLFIIYPVIFGLICFLYFRYITYKKHPIWFSILLPVILFLGYLQYKQLKVIGYCSYYIFKFIKYIIFNIKKICIAVFLYYLFYRVLKYNNVDIIGNIKNTWDCLTFNCDLSIFNITIDSIIGFIQNIMEYIISGIISIFSHDYSFCLFSDNILNEYDHIECRYCFFTSFFIIYVAFGFIATILFNLLDDDIKQNTTNSTRIIYYELYDEEIYPITKDKYNPANHDFSYIPTPHFLFSYREKMIYYKYQLLNNKKSTTLC